MTQLIPNRIFLTGFMGSGKTTVGPTLARRLGYGFIDTDEELVKQTGLSIAEIFSAQGEKEFRRLERAMIVSLFKQANVVIALGGGALVSSSNRQDVFSQGTVIYLKAGIETLAARLQATDRPLVKQYQGEALVKRIRDLLAERESTYAQSHYTIVTDGKSRGALVEEMMEKLEKCAK